MKLLYKHQEIKMITPQQIKYIKNLLMFKKQKQKPLHELI